MKWVYSAGANKVNSLLKYMTGVLMGYHVDNQYYVHTKEQYYKLYKDGDSLKDLQQLCETGHEALPSQLAVSFRDVPFGVTHKEILARFGRPRFLQEQEILRHYYATLFWREKTRRGLSGSRAVIQTHFFNDHFLHASYTVPNPGARGKQAIREALIRKYLQPAQNPTGDSFVTRDSDGHWISFGPSGSGIKVRYVSGRKDIWTTLLELKAAKAKEESPDSGDPVEQLSEML